MVSGTPAVGSAILVDGDYYATSTEINFISEQRYEPGDWCERVSTTLQATEGVSLEVQCERIREWALANGYQLGRI